MAKLRQAVAVFHRCQENEKLTEKSINHRKE